MFCPECGTRLPEGARFCPQCGHGLGSAVGRSGVAGAGRASDAAGRTAAPPRAAAGREHDELGDSARDAGAAARRLATEAARKAGTAASQVASSAREKAPEVADKASQVASAAYAYVRDKAPDAAAKAADGASKAASYVRDKAPDAAAKAAEQAASTSRRASSWLRSHPRGRRAVLLVAVLAVVAVALVGVFGGAGLGGSLDGTWLRVAGEGGCYVIEVDGTSVYEYGVAASNPDLTGNQYSQMGTLDGSSYHVDRNWHGGPAIDDYALERSGDELTETPTSEGWDQIPSSYRRATVLESVDEGSNTFCDLVAAGSDVIFLSGGQAEMRAHVAGDTTQYKVGTITEGSLSDGAQISYTDGTSAQLTRGSDGSYGYQDSTGTTLALSETDETQSMRWVGQEAGLLARGASGSTLQDLITDEDKQWMMDTFTQNGAIDQAFDTAIEYDGNDVTVTYTAHVSSDDFDSTGGSLLEDFYEGFRIGLVGVTDLENQDLFESMDLYLPAAQIGDAYGLGEDKVVISTQVLDEDGDVLLSRSSGS